jgi:uncharacterized lipoprotein
MRKGKVLWPLLFCFGLTSCVPLAFTVGAAAGIVSYKFYEGALEVVYQAPYMETWDATLRALEGMNIQVKTKEHDLTAGNIEAKRADKTQVRISVKYKSAKETEMVIRVGIMGDEEASNAIKEEIRKELFEK